MNTDKTKCFKVFAYPCLSAFIRGQNAFWRQLKIMNSSLTGKTILVLRLAQEGAGVAIHYRSRQCKEDNSHG